MDLFKPKYTTHNYEPPELHKNAANVTGLEITTHKNGIIRYFIWIGDGSHTGCHTGNGNSVSDAKKKLWKRLQEILPKEARKDTCVDNAFDSKEEETDEHSAGTIVQERENRQKVEHELDKMTERKEHHKKRKRLYRAEAEESAKKIKKLRKENQELRKKNAELLNNRLFGTDDEDDEDVPPIAKKPTPST